MTPELAEALLRWISNSSLISVRRPDQTVMFIRLLKHCPPEVAIYLSNRLGSDALHVTANGLAFDENRVQAEVAMTAVYLSRACDGEFSPAEILDSDFLSAWRKYKVSLKAAAVVDPPMPPDDPPSSTDEYDFPGDYVCNGDGIPWQLCDIAKAKQRQFEAPIKGGEDRKRILNALADRPSRWLPKVDYERIQAVHGLRKDYPHFAAVIDLIVQHLTLQRVVDGPLGLPPILLLGDPGLGKTAFVRHLAECLGMWFTFRSLSDVSGHMVITGNSTLWRNATPGIVARCIAECPNGQAPLLMLDELDKVRRDTDYPVDTALLGLLERNTAQHFHDENLDLELDVSKLSVLLTANRLDGIKPELISRMKIVRVMTPTRAQMPAIVRSVDRALRRDTPGIDAVFEPLTTELIDAFEPAAPRDVKRRLDEAYGRALTQGWPTGRDIAFDHPRLSLTIGQVFPGRNAPSETTETQTPPYVIPLYVEPRGWRRVQ